MAFYTISDLGRPATTEELDRRAIKLDEMWRAGKGFKPPVLTGVTTYELKREFDDLETANEWLAFLNTFTPPPVKAVVVTE